MNRLLIQRRFMRMKTTSKINEIRKYLSADEIGKIALVPTMGYLHSGQLKLVDAAKKHGDTVVVSIFVNPLQLGPAEALDNYPITIGRDLGILKANGAHYVFPPEVEEMYPADLALDISLNSMADVLDGVKRPGHFEGVVTVVNKLFNVIKPHYVTFGEKDRQQLMIVQKMIEDFNHDIEILAVKTEREDTGLAKSSRNTNLSDGELLEAPHVYESLQLGNKLIQSGERNVEEILKQITAHINENTSGIVDDLQILSHPDLDTMTHVGSDVIIFIAVQFEKARLIDNLMVKLND